ncbi:hypothetical protein [Petropleomorpha daqingensis]|uniref:Uncharacterized protein n=1 Tax=Petropleomorpha daqingensis TaxID=2026353 RepID=A0A853CNA4_9ACTN|nr:hypothetical protein [Petropleomorpha daqingensis]NYJ08289.1 hypothetical protein [Petropleomorpha daqingensis]
MTWLGLVLGGIGLADLVRWNSERFDRRSVLGCVLAGLLAAVVLVLGGVGPGTTAGTAVVVAGVSAAWVGTSGWSLREGRATWLPLAVATAVVVGAVVLSPWSPHVGGRLERWYAQVPLAVLSGVDLERLLVIAGCALLLTSTGNVLVRVVLTAAGSQVTRNEQQIKGGRVLGPMERLLVFGLGLAGDLGAAAVIVAAKGLLRFPELQSYRGELESSARPGLSGQRIDVLTEYFLIGSLTSWSLALACLLLT